LLVERWVIDRSKVALGADFGVDPAAFGYARRIDLPCRIVGEDPGRPFWRLQSAEAHRTTTP
jgi:hypothetical protein